MGTAAIETAGFEKLGCYVTDVITGFRGTVTGFVVYLSGCNQCLVTPRIKNTGELAASEWIDQQRLKVIDVERVVLD